MESISKYDDKKRIMHECNAVFQNSAQSHVDDAFVKKIHMRGIFIHAFCHETIGYAVIYANDYLNWNAYLTMIAVKRKYQGKGIGKALLSNCEQLAEECFLKSMTLEVKKDNVQAMGFYQRQGYSFYKAASENSIYMKKSLHGGTMYDGEKGS